MLRTLILTVAALAAPLILTPAAQAAPKGCADYITVCARPAAAHTGGARTTPVVLDPGCDHDKPPAITD